jgi:hypothetical protein
MSSLRPKVNIVKYIPLNLRLDKPTKRASKKLIKPPSPITTGKNNTFPRIAEIYMPIPKKAADARDMYRVGPEKTAQLTVRTIYIKMLVNDMT